MRIEDIKFEQKASQRIYNDYMKRIRKATASLSKMNQDDIYMEFNSHIFESIQNNKEKNEIDSLLDIIEKLGSPEEVLKPLVADKKLEQATKTFNPIHVFRALILNFTNGISYIFFFVLYLFLFGFVFLIFAKIFNPSLVGLYMKKDSFSVFVLGIINPEDQIKNQTYEVLGNWFIPAMLLSIVFFYLLITLLLKFKKSINQKTLS
ncbi:HAAS signaling domain-containing protein [Flavobacterium sp. FlaQc-48]|uniref:HAAS signaling domain-containing protein n=1 Tax=Flavobacterium sp. FlaQc-48 TaxID=3374181 RepID=UPI003757412A